jgi:hypothetical protein
MAPHRAMRWPNSGMCVFTNNGGAVSVHLSLNTRAT